MSRRQNTTIVVLVFILAFAAGNFVEPKYWNQGADVINNKLSIDFPKMPEREFILGLDLQGGTHLIYEADVSNVKEADITSSLQGLRDVIERRENSAFNKL